MLGGSGISKVKIRENAGSWPGRMWIGLFINKL